MKSRHRLSSSKYDKMKFDSASDTDDVPDVASSFDCAVKGITESVRFEMLFVTLRSALVIAREAI